MLLNDEQLVGLDPNIIKGLDRSGDLYAAKSPIQPASIDLAIGDIYLPGVKQGEEGSTEKPLSYHLLDAGHTAIVETREDLDLPPNLAAIGFPPTSVSSSGLLMTNPGHVDPGYKGKMRFTVINMGSKSFPLKRGELIVTLLFFRLDLPAKKSYSERYTTLQGDTAKVKEQLSKLAKDFLDFRRRTEDIATAVAKEVADKSESDARWMGLAIIGIAILSVIASFSVALYPSVSRIFELDGAVIENKLALEAEINKIKDKLERPGLEKRVEELERLVRKPEPRSPKP